MSRNQLSNGDLIQIAESASSLLERLTGAYKPVNGAASQALINSRLAEWKRVAAGDNEELFNKRLGWDGLQQPAVHKALGPVRLNDPQDLPAWTQNLQDLMQEASMASRFENKSEAKLEHRFLDNEPEIAFQDVLAPFIIASSKKLKEKVGASRELLTDDGFGELQRALLKNLFAVCNETLLLEFGIFRRERMSSLDILLARSDDEVQDDVYVEFVEHMLQGGLRDLFKEYSALARLISTISEQWVETSSEFIERLAADLNTIRKVFDSTGDLGCVSELQTLLSDRHNRGRSVIAATFESGLKLIYKPRDISSEAYWFDLLDWVNENGAPLNLKRLRCIRGSGYGWVEFVEHESCSDEGQAKNFYLRAGMLLALVYVLGGCDFHYENLIANGEHPVLVDLETIMHHTPLENSLGVNLDYTIDHPYYESVLRTSFLPRWYIGEGNRAVDISALGAVHEQESRIAVPVWKYVNTNLMELEHEVMKSKFGKNTPLLADDPLSPNNYAEEIKQGFRQMGHFLMENRAGLLARGGPLENFSKCPTRFIYRATFLYYMIMLGALRPEWLRVGVERSIQLDALAFPLLPQDEKPVCWSMIELERLALERQDCPYFIADSGADYLEAEFGRRIPGVLKEPCYATVISRLESLSGPELEKQINFIQASLDSRIVEEQHVPTDANEPPPNLETVRPLTADEMVEKAAELALQLERSALINQNGATWMTLRFLPEVRKSQLDPIGPDLFDGRCGVALFLAALARVSGKTKFRDLAYAVIKPLRKEIKEMMAYRMMNQVSVHGLTGVSIVTYSLSNLAGLLGDEQLLEDAKESLSFINTAEIDADNSLDVLSGTAGTILGLLSASRHLSSNEALERAVECGDHLLSKRSAGRNGLRAWATFEDKFITGFSHGIAGIACALLRLFQATDETRFKDAAIEAIEFEDSLFSPVEMNWPDLRWMTDEESAPTFADGWCHGGPGIALSRLDGLPVYDTPQIRKDIEAGIEVSKRANLHRVDHLCCGNMGRVNILFEAGQRLSRPSLVKLAHKSATWIVSRAEKKGTYKLWREQQRFVTTPGLFQGTSGIGYSLLRLAHPSKVPSVLLLE